jgi:hypothetical protein
MSKKNGQCTHICILASAAAIHSSASVVASKHRTRELGINCMHAAICRLPVSSRVFMQQRRGAGQFDPNVASPVYMGDEDGVA